MSAADEPPVAGLLIVGLVAGLLVAGPLAGPRAAGPPCAGLPCAGLLVAGPVAVPPVAGPPVAGPRAAGLPCAGLLVAGLPGADAPRAESVSAAELAAPVSSAGNGLETSLARIAASTVIFIPAIGPLPPSVLHPAALRAYWCTQNMTGHQGAGSHDIAADSAATVPGRSSITWPAPARAPSLVPPR